MFNFNRNIGPFYPNCPFTLRRYVNYSFYVTFFFHSLIIAFQPLYSYLSTLIDSRLYGKILYMLKIRLQRTGRKNNPAFRIVLTDSKNAAKSGKFKEILGSYDLKKGEIIIKEDRIK